MINVLPRVPFRNFFQPFFEIVARHIAAAQPKRQHQYNASQHDAKGDEHRLLADAEEFHGDHRTKGEFHHLMGNSDKGMAVRVLLELYKRKYGAVISVGLGDSPNDVPMLDAVDIPVLVCLPNGEHHPEVRLNNPRALLCRGVGPEGWNEAVLDILEGRIPLPEE